MGARNRHRPVIFTDDGWVFSGTEPPVTVKDIREKVVGSYAATGGALWWSTGDHEVYHFETQVGEIFGEEYAGLDESTYSFVHSGTPGVIDRVRRNVRAVIDECGGPMTALVDLCREAGLEFFPRVRMNSHYVIDPRHPAYGRFRRDHPELLIGRPDEGLHENSQAWGLRTGKNYALPEVREYMAQIIFETFERFDVDGVELDFMRHPGWFRIEEAYQSRYLMTDLIRHVRARMNEVGDERGRSLTLAVRVPSTLADSARTGLDVAGWIADGLVDIVVVGGGFIPFDTPVKEFVEAAEGTECLVYGCIEATRVVDDQAIVALANRWWDDGASGIYLYNFYTMAAEWNKRIYDQLSDPSSLKRLDKRYELGSTGGFYPCAGHGCGFRYASPAAQLPVTLQEDPSGPGPTLRFEVNDDLSAATADGALGACTLALRFDNLTAGDRLEVRINQRDLPWASGRVSLQGWSRLGVHSLFWMQYPAAPEERTQEGQSVEFDLDCPPLREGENEIEVRLATSGARRDSAVVLKGVEVAVSYR